ncbi:MAG: 5-carboxymethyl-2-hydroxymuconate isomerase [Oceanospirillaceae bacterium]
MPHCIIECSSEVLAHINSQQLIDTCFDAALASELFSADDIKVRIISVDQQRIGYTQNNGLHVQLKILSGRDGAQKKHLSTIFLSAIAQFFQQQPPRDQALNLSVQVLDIDRDSYQKVIV